MKYLRLFESVKKTNIEKKIELLEVLSLGLTDLGLDLTIYNNGKPVIGELKYSNYFTHYDNNYIYLFIRDKHKILNKISESAEFLEFLEVLKSHNMNWRKMSLVANFVVLTFDKHGHMTNSNSWKNF
jgi:hypothetical protein